MQFCHDFEEGRVWFPRKNLIEIINYFYTSVVYCLQVKLFYAKMIKQSNIAGNSECKSGVNPAQYRLL